MTKMTFRLIQKSFLSFQLCNLEFFSKKKCSKLYNLWVIFLFSDYTI